MADDLQTQKKLKVTFQVLCHHDSELHGTAGDAGKQAVDDSQSVHPGITDTFINLYIQ
jgi:hypothetical protein